MKLLEVESRLRQEILREWWQFVLAFQAASSIFSKNRCFTDVDFLQHSCMIALTQQGIWFMMEDVMQ